MASDLALLREAARAAGLIAMRYFGKAPEVWFKAGDSPVSEADYAVDKYLRETLLAARPDYGWLSEETADTHERLTARRTFVVDPIDGTRAFVDGRTTWCVSIAVVEAGTSLAGVLDCPARDEIFWASAGGGAFLDGRPIAIAPVGRRPKVAGPRAWLKRADAELGLPIDHVAYIPSLAYRIAMIARGEIDATFVKAGSHDWDLAAAALILAEAGGRIVDATGAEPAYAGADPRRRMLVAGSGPLLSKLAGMIAGE